MDKGWSSVVTALVALVVGIGSALITVRVASQTIKNQTTISRNQERAAFVLAAAQYVMGQETCQAALQKARVLRAIFPHRLGADFGNPIALAFGRYRYDAKRKEYVPLPDPTGCTSAKPIPVKTAYLPGFFGSKGAQSFNPKDINPFSRLGTTTTTFFPTTTFLPTTTRSGG